MTASDKLREVMNLVNFETKLDTELYNQMDSGQITFEEYKAQSPRYSSQIHVLAAKLGIEY